MSVQYFFGTGGFDLHFTLPVLTVNAWVAVRCDSAFTLDDQDEASPTGTIKLKRITGGFEVSLLDAAGSTLESYAFNSISAQSACRVRVRLRNDAVSVTIDEYWAVTLWLRDVQHPETSAVYLLASGSIAVTDIRLTELCAGQDKIEVDIEESAANAISAVLKRRPVLQWAREDGALCCAYDPPLATHETLWAWGADRQRALSDKAASDGLVYCQDRTVVVIDDRALEEIGLVTRALRYTDLEHGAITAGRKTLEKGRQDANRVTIKRALMPAMEAYDRLSYALLIGGGVAGMEGTCIVDRITVDIAGAAAKATIEGRAV